MTQASEAFRSYETTRRAVPEIGSIAITYMLAGLGAFILMGVLGLLLRTQQAGVLPIDAQSTYAIMTLHGAGMVSAVQLAAMGGVAYVLHDRLRLSTRLLWIVFILNMLGMGFVILSTLVGGFGAGWTVMHPLPYRSLGTWSIWAALATYLGYFVIAFAFLLFCVGILVAGARAYGSVSKALGWPYLFSRGRSGKDDLPPPAHIAAGVVSVAGIVAVVAGVLLLVPLFAQAAQLIEPVDALIAKVLVFLYGHTTANLTIYLTAALVYTLLPRLTGRPWKTTWLVALALNSVVPLVLLPFFHHLYQDFVVPVPLLVVGQIASYLVPLPAFLVTIIGGMSQFYRSGVRWTVPTILIAVGLWGWTFGGLGAVIDATIPVNQVMHNTMWVPAHFHTYYLLGAASFAWAFLYWLTSELGSVPETASSRWAAWLYGIGGAGFILSFFVSGAMSVPRRFAEHDAAWQGPDLISIPFVVLTGLAALWLTGDILLRAGKAWVRAVPE